MSDEDVVYFPIDFRFEEKLNYIVSIVIPRQKFEDPFLLDSLSGRLNIATVNKEKSGDQNLLVRPLYYDENDPRIKLIPLDQFLKDPKHSTIPSPKLRFIFHMSRCGSTLITQMLATSERFFVISEPPIINKLLDPSLIIPAEYSKSELIKSILIAIESCKPKDTEYTFIKFRSWNTLFLDEFIRDFPQVQWMFIHRDGLEVLESVLRDPPGWLRNRLMQSNYFARFLDIEAERLLSMGNEEYAARMLGTFCRKVNVMRSQDTFLVDYIDLKKSFFRDMRDRWHISLTEQEIELMERSSRLYSKDVTRTKIFEPDSEEKRKKLTENQERLVKKFVEAERLKLTV